MPEEDLIPKYHTCDACNAQWDNLIARLHNQRDTIKRLTESWEELKNENYGLKGELSNYRHEVEGWREENIRLREENKRIVSGYPQNAKAMLDKICQLVRDHEALARKLSKKSQECAALRKEKEKEQQELFTRIAFLETQNAIWSNLFNTVKE